MISSNFFSASAASATSAASSPPISSNALQATAQIRQLNLLGTELDETSLEDELSEGIHRWQREFLKELQGGGDREEICRQRIDLLQMLLSDPLTGAPLDQEAFLGNDGKTYSKMAYAIHLLRMPEKYHAFSPLDLQTPFSIHMDPHPSVAPALRWLAHQKVVFDSQVLCKEFVNLIARNPERILYLQKRNALPDQENLEDFYNDLLSAKQPPPLTQEEKVAAIYKGTADLNLMEAQRRINQIQEVGQRARDDLSRMRKALNERIPESSELKARIAEAKEKALQEQHKLAQQGSAAASATEVRLEAIEKKLDALALQEECDVRETQELLAAVEQEETRATEQLTREIHSYIQEDYRPFAEKIEEMLSSTDEKLKSMQAADKQSLAGLVRTLNHLKDEIQQLQAHNEKLENQLTCGRGVLNEVEKERLRLDQSITAAKADVAKLKQRTNESLLKTVLGTGVCLFAAVYLPSSLQLMPAKGGGTIGYTLAF